MNSGGVWCFMLDGMVVVCIVTVTPSCVVGCGMAVGGVHGSVVCLVFLSLLLLLLVFRVVRAQPCEHARYP